MHIKEPRLKFVDVSALFNSHPFLFHLVSSVARISADRSHPEVQCATALRGKPTLATHPAVRRQRAPRSRTEGGWLVNREIQKTIQS